MFVPPSIADFKTYFFRDFPYATDVTDLTKVQDQDILNALSDAGAEFNETLFSDMNVAMKAFLLLTAHFMVMNLRASSQGINGQFTWLQNSRSVGSVSESLAIPQRILDNPEFAIYTKTTYGARYLAMVLPLLSGVMFNVCGGTNA